MKYAYIKAFDIPDAWHQVLNRIWNEGDVFKVGYGSEETETKKLNLSIEIEHPENRPLVDDKAPCDMKYVQSYALEYLFSGMIKDETYTYGSRLREPVDQIEKAIERFAEVRNDRQVTLVVRRPEDILKEIEKGRRHEPPCLTMLDLEIVEHDGKSKLHTTGYFRSWDGYAGLPANLAGLQVVIESIVNDLNMKGAEKHKDWEEVYTGKMILHSKNCHIYQRQYKIVEDLLKPQKTARIAQKMQKTSSSSLNNQT
jgi:thymidylate synthase